MAQIRYKSTSGLLVFTLAAYLMVFLNPINSNAALVDAGKAYGVYIDAPRVQGSFVSPLTTTERVETFDSVTTNLANCPAQSNVGIFSGGNGSCRVILSSNGGGYYPYGGALTTDSEVTLTGTQSPSAAVYDSNGTTITFPESSNYIGFWWTAGSYGNTIRIYSNGALRFTLSADDVYSLIPKTSDSLTSVDGLISYVKSDYYGHPIKYGTDSRGENWADNEPYVFIHIFGQNGESFDKINISTTGNGFEFDNLTIANVTNSISKNHLVGVAGYGNVHTVTFDSQGGTAVETSTFVEDGVGNRGTVTLPQSWRSGYTFNGWFTSSSGGTPLASPYQPPENSDITLYAQWTATDTPDCSPTYSSLTYTDEWGISTTLPENVGLVKFTNETECKWSPPSGLSSFRYLIVGGGGGGGFDAGGGGGGGSVNTGTIANVAGKVFYIKAGGGGVGATSSVSSQSGGTSYLSVEGDLVSAPGGTGGGNCGWTGSFCGDNGGGYNAKGSGTGGDGVYHWLNTNFASSGANGISSNITGRSLTFGSGGGGGGGGGGAYLQGALGGWFDLANTIRGGGSGGSSASASTVGLSNTGSGGGGGFGGANGGNGAKGVIYLRATSLSLEFDSQGGSPVSNRNFYFGSTINSAPETPTKSNANFLGWFDASSGGSQINFPFTPTEEINLTLFARWVNTFTIISSAGVNGEISVSGTTNVVAGNNQSYIFTPSTGYKVSDVTVDGVSVGVVSNYTFTNVQSNHLIHVNFERIPSGTQIVIPDPSANMPAPSTTPMPTPTPIPTPKPTPTAKQETTKSSNGGGTSTQPSSTKNQIKVENGTVVIAPTQIAELKIANSGSGGSANIGISQLRSGQRIRVTVISQTALSQPLNLAALGIVKVFPQINRATKAVIPVKIDITPKKIAGSKSSEQAKISVTGVKKNQRIKVTVRSR